MTPGQWKKNLASIEKKINIDFGNSFVLFQRYNRNDKEVVYIYEHANKKHIITLFFFNPINGISFVDVSFIEKTNDHSTIKGPNKLLKKIELDLEQEDEIIS